MLRLKRIPYLIQTSCFLTLLCVASVSCNAEKEYAPDTAAAKSETEPLASEENGSAEAGADIIEDAEVLDKDQPYSVTLGDVAPDNEVSVLTETLSVHDSINSEAVGGGGGMLGGRQGLPAREYDERTATYSLSRVEDASADGEGHSELSREARLRGHTPVPSGNPEESKTKDSAPKKEATTWKRAKATPNASRLMIGSNDELGLQAMQISVSVEGWRARVVIDNYYMNDRDRQLEGTFKLRLPDGASPYYFAFGQTAFGSNGTGAPVFFDAREDGSLDLDPENIRRVRQRTWQEVREARMVQKEKAAHAYTEVVRRRVDPALMEWAGSGIFNARVFPLAPKQLHRIVIGYDLDLTQLDGGDILYNLDLPEAKVERVVEIGLRGLAIESTTVKPETDRFTLLKNDKVEKEAFRWDNPDANQISLRVKAPGNVAIVGKDEGSGEFSALRFRADLPTEKAGGASRGLFLIDTSLSSQPDNYNIYLKLLESMLAKNADSMKYFNMLFFNVEQHFWKTSLVANSEENRRAAINYAFSMTLEGASDIGSAISKVSSSLAMRPRRDAPPIVDIFLLSDGALTWGERDLNAIKAKLNSIDIGSLFAYRTGMGSDSRVLNALANSSGGAVFSVLNDEQVLKAATAHTARPWRIKGMRSEELRDLLVAGRPGHLYPGQEIVVVGRGSLSAGEEKFALELVRGTETIVVEPTISRTVESVLAPRIYGQVATGQLEDLAPITQDVAEAYARHFRIPGQTCSLLMLESEADYKQYNINPKDDVMTVSAVKATNAVETAIEELGDQLGSAKQRFIAWVEKLESIPNFGIELTPALKAALKSLPESSFTVAPDRLVCTMRTKDDIESAVRDALAKQHLDYATVVELVDARIEDSKNADALRLLSSLVERNPGDTDTARDVAFSAMKMDFGGQAYHLLQRVAESRPWEPDTYRLIARSLIQAGNTDLAIAYYELALSANWMSRYGEFAKILALDYSDLLSQIEAGKVTTKLDDLVKARRERLSKSYKLNEADIVVTMTWNTDNTDIDLHVLEPTGEECFYSHPTTRIGGHITQDVTQGYGPEMYTLPNARKGEYKIMVKYYASNRNRSQVNTRVSITVYRNWGRANQYSETRTLTVKNAEEKVEVLTLNWK